MNTLEPTCCEKCFNSPFNSASPLPCKNTMCDCHYWQKANTSEPNSLSVSFGKEVKEFQENFGLEAGYALDVVVTKLLSQQKEERYFHPLMERQFTRMFTSYAKYFNFRYERSGNLFYRPFRRVAVDDDSHLQWLIYYIHHNPRKHKVMEKEAICVNKPFWEVKTTQMSVKLSTKGS